MVTATAGCNAPPSEPFYSLPKNRTRLLSPRVKEARGQVRQASTGSFEPQLVDLGPRSEE
jgi:hypothetical protein